MSFFWNRTLGAQQCPVAHHHRGDTTCRPGGSGSEPGAQNGAHYHVGSSTCCAGDPPLNYTAPDPRYCVRPHHHVNDPTWRPEQG